MKNTKFKYLSLKSALTALAAATTVAVGVLFAFPSLAQDPQDDAAFTCASAVNVMDCIKQTGTAAPATPTDLSTNANSIIASTANSALKFTGPISAGIRYDNYLAWILDVGYAQEFANTAAAFKLSAGLNERRANVTLGYAITPKQQIKLTYEYLSQNLPFDYASGTVNEWVNQNAFGAAYRYMLDLGILRSLEAYATYTKAGSKELSEVEMYTDNLLTQINYRRIAGGTEKVAGANVTLTPFKSTVVKVGGGYSTLNFDTKWQNSEDTAALVYNAEISHLLTPSTMITTGIGNTASGRTHTAKISQILPWSLEASVLGQYTATTNDIPSATSVTASLSYPAPKTYTNMFAEGIGKLKDWVEKPVIYNTRVLAKAEERVVQVQITKSQIPDTVIPAGDSITPILTSNYFAFNTEVFDKISYKIASIKNKSDGQPASTNLNLQVTPLDAYNAQITSIAPTTAAMMTPGDYVVTIEAQGYRNGQVVSQVDNPVNISVVVNDQLPAPVLNSAATLPDATANSTNYSADLNVLVNQPAMKSSSGSTDIYTFALAATNNWLQIAPDKHTLISTSTPLPTQSNIPVSLKTTSQASGKTSEPVTYTITISGTLVGPQWSSEVASPLPAATEGSNYSGNAVNLDPYVTQYLTQTTKNGSAITPNDIITFSIPTSGLPTDKCDWLSITSSGTLSGTPTSATSCGIYIQVHSTALANAGQQPNTYLLATKTMIVNPKPDEAPTWKNTSDALTNAVFSANYVPATGPYNLGIYIKDTGTANKNPNTLQYICQSGCTADGQNPQIQYITGVTGLILNKTTGDLTGTPTNWQQISSNAITIQVVAQNSAGIPSSPPHPFTIKLIANTAIGTPTWRSDAPNLPSITIGSGSGYGGANGVDLNTYVQDINNMTGSPMTGTLTYNVSKQTTGGSNCSWLTVNNNILSSAPLTDTALKGTVCTLNITATSAASTNTGTFNGKQINVVANTVYSLQKPITPNATYQVAYNNAQGVNLGDGTYFADGYPDDTFTFSSPTLPTGMSLSSTGLLSGTPTNINNIGNNTLIFTVTSDKHADVVSPLIAYNYPNFVISSNSALTFDAKWSGPLPAAYNNKSYGDNNSIKLSDYITITSPSGDQITNYVFNTSTTTCNWLTLNQGTGVLTSSSNPIGPSTCVIDVKITSKASGNVKDLGNQTITILKGPVWTTTTLPTSFVPAYYDDNTNTVTIDSTYVNSQAGGVQNIYQTPGTESTTPPWLIVTNQGQTAKSVKVTTKTQNDILLNSINANCSNTISMEALDDSGTSDQLFITCLSPNGALTAPVFLPNGINLPTAYVAAPYNSAGNSISPYETPTYSEIYVSKTQKNGQPVADKLTFDPIIPSNLPGQDCSWLSLSTTGVFSGTPLSIAPCSFSVTIRSKATGKSTTTSTSITPVANPPVWITDASGSVGQNSSIKLTTLTNNGNAIKLNGTGGFMSNPGGGSNLNIIVSDSAIINGTTINTTNPSNWTTFNDSGTFYLVRKYYNDNPKQLDASDIGVWTNVVLTASNVGGVSSAYIKIMLQPDNTLQIDMPPISETVTVGGNDPLPVYLDPLKMITSDGASVVNDKMLVDASAGSNYSKGKVIPSTANCSGNNYIAYIYSENTSNLLRLDPRGTTTGIRFRSSCYNNTSDPNSGNLYTGDTATLPKFYDSARDGITNTAGNDTTFLKNYKGNLINVKVYAYPVFKTPTPINMAFDTIGGSPMGAGTILYLNAQLANLGVTNPADLRFNITAQPSANNFRVLDTGSYIYFLSRAIKKRTEGSTEYTYIEALDIGTTSSITVETYSAQQNLTNAPVNKATFQITVIPDSLVTPVWDGNVTSTTGQVVTDTWDIPFYNSQGNLSFTTDYILPVFKINNFSNSGLRSYVTINGTKYLINDNIYANASDCADYTTNKTNKAVYVAGYDSTKPASKSVGFTLCPPPTKQTLNLDFVNGGSINSTSGPTLPAPHIQNTTTTTGTCPGNDCYPCIYQLRSVAKGETTPLDNSYHYAYVNGTLTAMRSCYKIDVKINYSAKP